MILPIIKHPAKILRKKARKVKDPLDPEIQKLITNIIGTLEGARGLGLAAPQVGKSLRLCVIKEPENQGESRLYVLINPSIKSKSRKKIIMEEGCLSFPGKFFLISRPEKIKVRYLDEKGKKCKIKAEGILSRAFQHEIDHLDGVLIIDKIKNK